MITDRISGDSKAAGSGFFTPTDLHYAPAPARPDNICIHCDEPLTPEEMSPNNKTLYICYNCWVSGKRNAVIKQPTGTIPDGF